MATGHVVDAEDGWLCEVLLALAPQLFNVEPDRPTMTSCLTPTSKLFKLVAEPSVLPIDMAGSYTEHRTHPHRESW